MTSSGSSVVRRRPSRVSWRANAIAREQEMKALVAENRARVVLAEAEVPLAMATAFRAGTFHTNGAEPLAAFVGSAVVGVDPRVMGIGPVPAVGKLLERSGVGVDELDLVELNEAFASQSLVVIRELGLDPERVNVNGGAIALGHPLGMSGARLVVTLLHELRRREGRYGLATLCVGVGQGQAALFER